MYGRHVEKGSYKSITNALRDASKLWPVAQIVTHGPRTLRMNKVIPDEIKQFIDSIGMLVWVHSSYPTLPWKGEEHVITSLKEQLDVAYRCNAKGVVVHLPHSEPLDVVVRYIPLFNDPRIPTVLEMPSAKPANAHYSTPAKINDLISALLSIRPKINFGICIDTSHIWAANTSTRTYTEAKLFLESLEYIPDIHLIHLNGTNVPLGGGRDVHIIPGSSDDLIWGNIPYESSGIRAFVEFSQKYNIPLLMEINRGDDSEVERIHKLLKSKMT